MEKINAQITELQSQLESSRNELSEIRKEIIGLEIKKNIRQVHVKDLENQITQLKADQYNKEAQKRLINKGYEYIGKTDEMNSQGIYAECYIDNVHLLLFEYGNGIGSTYVGVCPKCDVAIDFTKYKTW